MSDPAPIASRFVAARQTGAALPDYPGPHPRSLSEAYAIQATALALSGRAVAGWKIGRVTPSIDGVDRFAGPICGDRVTSENDSDAPVFTDGFAAAEAEFLLHLARTPDPAQRCFSHADARALIDAVHVGIEIASSPFPGIAAHGPLITISDFGNNNGLIVGDPLTGWQELELEAVPVEMHINGAQVGAATAATMLDGPWGAARFLLEHMTARGLPLAAGQWISSGAVTGVHRITVGDRVEAIFGPHRVRCTISAERAAIRR